MMPSRDAHTRAAKSMQKPKYPSPPGTCSPLRSVDAAEGVVDAAVKGDGKFVGEAFPGEVVELGGVDEDAIKVEEDGL